MLPKNRQALLDEKKTPTGPIVSNANGTVSSNRTYQDLLKIQETNLILRILLLLSYTSKFKRNSIII
jgi:hypothetical protein